MQGGGTFPLFHLLAEERFAIQPIGFFRSDGWRTTDRYAFKYQIIGHVKIVSMTRMNSLEFWHLSTHMSGEFRFEMAEGNMGEWCRIRPTRDQFISPSGVFPYKG